MEYDRTKEVDEVLMNDGLDDFPPGAERHDVVLGEAGEFETFLGEIDLPFEYPYLNLALQFYQFAMKAPTVSMGFISLMNGMEALLSPGGPETGYSTSRNAAVLLAVPEDQSEDIFKRMMSLFKKRGVLLFGQSEVKKSREVDRDDVEFLRTLLERGIIRAYRLGFDKVGLLNFLNRSRF